MIKILSIGNSFSEDSTKYLYDMAKCEGLALKVVNLYIGGCCLERHWNNVQENKADYDYQLNGRSSGRYVTILETLQEDDWDVITLQQCSGFSGLIDTYHPYARLLSDYIKLHAPEAKQFIHQTWAYEMDSDHEQFGLYHQNQSEMFQALTACYRSIADELSLEIIPFGLVIQTLRQLPAFDYINGGKSLCRDGYHMHEVYGRYALAATWCAFIVKSNILDNPYEPPIIDGVAATGDELVMIKKCVSEVVSAISKV